MAVTSKPREQARKPHEIPLPPSPPQSSKEYKPKKSKKSKQKEAHAEGDSTEWLWTSLTDSSSSKHPPIFTKDGSYFFSIIGPSIKIHSAATGQVISTLSNQASSTSHENSPETITSAILNPHNAFQLITGSLDGCIKIWDFLDAVLLQTVDIAQPITHLCAHEKFKDSVYVSVKRPAKMKTQGAAGDNSIVLLVSLKPTPDTASARIYKSSQIIPIGKTRSPSGLSVSPNGEWLIATGGHKAYVAMTSALGSGFTKYVSPERLTCLAVHPLDEYFATGDEKGQIRLWYCLSQQANAHVAGTEKRAQTTTMHWHAHAVSSIAFTLNGAYLLSGGEESVLVIWQLHTGKKEYVPRVGAPITSIVVSRSDSAEEYLLALADASFVFVNASTLQISRSYARIKLDPTSSNGQSSTFATTPIPLAVHSLSSTLILPSSHPSSLQTYAPSISKIVAELEVSPSNRVSRRDEKPLVPTRVERAVLSSSGEWMTTIDSREGDESFPSEIYMKIWWWDRNTGSWILNTRIDKPHGTKKITSIAFRPGVRDSASLQLVTTGDDNNIKTWGIRKVVAKSGSGEDYWVPRSTFGFRSETPKHASWSPDGSLLAVTLGPYVSLYNPSTNALIRALTSSECRAPHSAYFVGQTGRHLVVAGAKDVVLWDLVSTSIRWYFRDSYTITAVVPHPLEDSFCLFHKSNESPEASQHPAQISLFRCSSHTPYKTYTMPFSFLNMAWYQSSLTSSSQPSFSLVGITNTWSVLVFGNNIQISEEEGSKAQTITAGVTLPKTISLFQEIFGESVFADPSNEASSSKQPAVDTSRPWTGSAAANVFNTPAYLMPSLDTLFEPLMDSFINLKPVEVEARRQNILQPGEDDMVVNGDSQALISLQPRIVDAYEMDALVDLFFQHALQPVDRPAPPAPPQNDTLTAVHHKTPRQPKSTPSSTPAVDPTPKIPKVNGILPQNQLGEKNATPQKSQTLVSTESAPLVNGHSKKRKKSIG